MKKSEFWTGEISQMFDISIETIRYYNKIGLLSPARKSENNYRYFALNHVSNVHSVVLLRDIGVPIEMIQSIYQSNDPDVLFDKIMETQELIQEKIERLMEQQRELKRFENHIKSICTDAQEIHVRPSPKWYSIWVSDELDIPELVKSFNQIQKEKTNVVTYAFVLPKENFLAHTRNYSKYGLLLDTFLQLPEFPYETTVIDSQECACYTYVGKQADLQDAYDDLFDWISEHDYQVTGDIIERFILSSPNCSLMELWAPVKQNI